MRLADYLKQEKSNSRIFAEEVGASQSAVIKWIYGKRFPRHHHLKRILQVTDGKVTANDFYTD